MEVVTLAVLGYVLRATTKKGQLFREKSAPQPSSENFGYAYAVY